MANPPELVKKFAIRHHDNVKAAEGLTFSFAGIVGVFVLFHVGRTAYHGFGLGKAGSPVVSVITAPIRMIRKIAIHSFPMFPSLGHASLVGIYSALNIIFLFTFMNNENFGIQTNLASRTGWMALLNMLLGVFLALKNTPLAFLTAWSYERLNVLHRYAGLYAVLHMIIHACCYSAYFAEEGEGSMLTSNTSIYGTIAGSCFFILGLTGIFLRKRWYELFYYTHIILFALSVVMTGLHQPSFVDGLLVMTVLCGSMWFLDRLIRFGRLVLYSTNNSVTLTPLPHGGTRVTLAKAPIAAKSGKHCFLWIPAIRGLETHPFTISAMDPLEFVVTSHDGFTKDLHDRAVAHPGVPLRASVEGSYGTFPSAKNFDKVVMVAGGTGASFTFGVALNALKELKENSNTKIMFIWTVRHRSLLGWYKEHLWTLSRDSRVSVHIYVTKGTQPFRTGPPSVTESERRRFDGEITSTNNSSASSVSGDAEKTAASVHESVAESDMDLNTFAGSPITWKRAEVPSIIRGVVSETSKDQSVLVMGCGPSALMKQVRNTTAECVTVSGPTVELHCEEFGW